MRGLIRWAWRLLVRDFRSRENWLLLVVLLLAVSAVSSVGFLTNRVEKLITYKAHDVLAADLRLESGRFSEHNPYESLAQRYHVRCIQALALNSILHKDDRWQLINLLAVEPGYPLRGDVKIADTPYGAERVAQSVPNPGEVWLDPKIMIASQVRLLDRVTIGSASLIVTQVLASRPDQGGGLTELAPTVLINMGSLQDLKLVTPSSRLTSSYLFAGAPDDISALAKKLSQQKSPAEKLITIDKNDQRLAESLTRARHFFNLTTLVTLTLCVVSLWLSTRRYLYRHWDHIALMKCLGLTRQRIWQLVLLQLIQLGLIVAALGVCLGWLISQVVGAWLAGQFAVALPWPDLAPAWLAVGSLGLMLIGFSLPTLRALVDVPVMRILRKDVELPVPQRLVVVSLGLAAVGSLLLILLNDIYLIAVTGVGLVLAIAVYYGFTLGLLSLAERVAANMTGVYRLVATRLVRRRRATAMEVTALALSLTGLAVLSLTRADVLSQWQQSLPANTPNTFMINIPKDLVRPFGASLQSLSQSPPLLMPWIRGRLVAVNDGALRESKNARLSGLSEREQNISVASELPVDNQIVAGQFWHGVPKTPEISVAKEFADSLGLKIGDRLQFDLAGTPLAVTLTSIRQVRWDGFKPNFFLLLSPTAADESIGSYMTSVYLTTEQRTHLVPFIKDYPSVTIFDVEQILKQVRELVGHAVIAVEWTFTFTLLAGLMVLLSMVEASMDERYYETAILSALGVSPRKLWWIGVAEFALIGTLSALLALLVAIGVSAYMAIRIFEFDWQFRPMSYVLLGLLATLMVTVLGAWVSAAVVRRSPMSGLQDADFI